MRYIISYVYLIFVIITGILAQSNYVESDDDIKDKTDDLRTLIFYKRLLQRITNDELMELVNDDHLMMRKSQRSPSLRLRFGRSSPNTKIEVPQRIFKFKDRFQNNQIQEY